MGKHQGRHQFITKQFQSALGQLLKTSAAFCWCNPGSLLGGNAAMQEWKAYKGWTYLGPSTDSTGHFLATCTIFSCNWRNEENIQHSLMNVISDFNNNGTQSKSISPKCVLIKILRIFILLWRFQGSMCIPFDSIGSRAHANDGLREARKAAQEYDCLCGKWAVRKNRQIDVNV